MKRNEFIEDSETAWEKKALESAFYLDLVVLVSRAVAYLKNIGSWHGPSTVDCTRAYDDNKPQMNFSSTMKEVL